MLMEKIKFLLCVFLLVTGLCSCSDDDDNSSVYTMEFVKLSEINYTTELEQPAEGKRVENYLTTLYRGEDEGEITKKGNCLYYYYGERSWNYDSSLFFVHENRCFLSFMRNLPHPSPWQSTFLVDGTTVLITGYWNSYDCSVHYPNGEKDWCGPLDKFKPEYGESSCCLEIESLKIVIP